MAKKPEYVQPELGGVDWSSAVHDPDMQHDRWRDVPRGEGDYTGSEPEENNLNLNDKQFPGYHSTSAPRESIAKSGLKTSSPTGDSSAYGQGIIGVYYHHYPQAEYGKDIYRLAIDHTRTHADNPPEGEALARNISAKNVTRIGHRAVQIDFPKTNEVHYEQDMDNPDKQCPLCVSAVKHADAMYAKRTATNG
jgi:hypothetical protein